MDIDNLVKEAMNPNSFVEQLNTIAIPIRKAISCQQNNFTGKLRAVRKIQYQSYYFL